MREFLKVIAIVALLLFIFFVLASLISKKSNSVLRQIDGDPELFYVYRDLVKEYHDNYEKMDQKTRDRYEKQRLYYEYRVLDNASRIVKKLSDLGQV